MFSIRINNFIHRDFLFSMYEHTSLNGQGCTDYRMRITTSKVHIFRLVSQKMTEIRRQSFINKIKPKQNMYIQ